MTESRNDILVKNLLYYLNKLDLTQTEFAREMKYPETTVSNWFNKNTYPRPDKIQEIANYFGIRRTDLTESSEEPQAPLKNAQSIPILGTIAAGSPILAEENIVDYFLIDSRVRADFGLCVKGDSMVNANIYDGDIVFIRQQPTLENGEIGAILIDDEATLKRFSLTNNSIILQAENPDLTDWPRVYTSGNIRVLGKLVGVYSKKD
ncbi:LexA family transcriptional regulator [Peptoniphilus sp. BV3C26]|uniref:LexA family protein n=1 Tax=Peptoniphilus sp. BV3C26 TaxID=1111134 RepID=UPI0003B8E690|nr:LexA family transcriptional regulator [Peptoniphilus sp. BV3C26]ERT57731.1 peptidase S24-like protein [Peptoniphilus sp. BV3C26]